MEDSLRREQHTAETHHAHFARQKAVVEQGVAALENLAEDTVLSSEVQALISRCLLGTESFENDLGAERKPWHQDKFNPQNVKVVMLRAAGLRQKEIAQMLGLDQATVCTTLAHPYGRKILHALIPATSARVIDIRTKMELYAGELLDHAYNLAMESTDVKEVREVTFGILDRAGYNVVNKNASAVVAPKDLERADSVMLGRLHSALDESMSIDRQVMPGWKAPVPPDDSHLLPDQLNDSPVPAGSEDSAHPEDVQFQRGSAPSSGSSQRTGTDN